MATVSSSHTPDTPSLHITHEQGASHVVEISNNGTDYILEVNQNISENNIVVNGDGASDYQLVVTQSVDDFNVVIGGGIPDYFEISNLPTLGTAAAQNIEYFALAVHTHAISEVTGLQAALDAAALSGEDNVQSDWQETNSSADSFILNKPVLFDGQYGNLTGLPTLFDGNYNSLSNLPTLFDGDYTSLTNLPTLFDGDYNSLTNLPALFDGTYASLTGKPTLFDGDYNSLTNLPTLFDGAYASLSGLPTLFSESYNDLTDLPTLFDGAYSSLSGLPTLFDGAYSSLTGTPTLFSGAYADLTGKPTLGTAAATDSTAYATAAQGLLADSAVQPADIADFATETYVDTAVSNLVDSAPGTLDTLNELAAAIGDDANFSTTITNQIAAIDEFPGFGTTAGLALEGNTALFDGAYSSLSGLPTLFDGAYSSLTGTPTIPTNNNQLTNGAGYIDDYTVTEGDVTAHEAALTIAYSQLTSTPSTFTPSAHTHTASEITDFDTEVSNNTSVAANTSKVTFPGFGTTSGTALEGDTALFSGAYADLTGKPTLFDGDYTSLTNLPTLFDGDYNSLTNLPTLFDGAYGSLTGTPTLGTAAAAATTDFAAASHTHVIADITGLQTALDGAGEDNVQADWDETDAADDSFIANKPTVPSSIDDLTDVDTNTSAASTGDVLRWSGTQWAPDAPSAGGTQADWDETDSADPAFILNKPDAVADLTNHLATVTLATEYLINGASVMDFDYTSQTQVLNMSATTTVGTNITWASDKFTVNADGVYTVTATGQFNTVGISRAMPALYIAVNGTVQEGADSAYIRNAGGAVDDSASLTRTFDLTDGDEVTLVIENIGNHSGTAIRARTLVFEMFNHSMTVIGIDGTIGDDNVQSDWNETDTGADSFILNKPTIPTAFSGDYDDLTNKPTLVTSVDGLSDVDTTTATPTVGDVLEWDGSNWVPAEPSGGGTTYTFSVSGTRRWSSNYDRWHTGDPTNGLSGDSSTQVWTDFNPEIFDTSTPYYYALNGHFIPTACTKVRVIGMVYAFDADLNDEDLDIELFRMTSYTDNGNSGTGDFFHTEATTFPSSSKMRLFDTGEISQTFVSGDTISVFWKVPNTTQTSGNASFNTSYTVIVY